MSPWRPVGETGRALNELYGLYGITATDIRRHGGPSVTTLSMLKRQPSSVPVREDARQELAHRIADGYCNAITSTYDQNLQPDKEFREKTYRIIKEALDKDATSRLPTGLKNWIQ